MVTLLNLGSCDGELHLLAHLIIDAVVQLLFLFSYNDLFYRPISFLICFRGSGSELVNYVTAMPRPQRIYLNRYRNKQHGEAVDAHYSDQGAEMSSQNSFLDAWTEEPGEVDIAFDET